ncbi:hypothetical protein [Streptomyces sp. NPDC090025]|uniref:hypothetical protein n=1 Tax=Streptomyces sp. NPDC090025 TaxID=3365922 RepID=UPI00383394FF
MTRARRTAAALLALLPLGALGACGIQKSEVVEAGPAATVTVHPTDDHKNVLFFVGPNGGLMLVARDVGRTTVFGRPDGRPTPDPTHPDGFRTERGTRDGTDEVLASLLKGPNAEERAAGLHTAIELPRQAKPHTTPQEATDGSTILHVRMVARVSELSPLARRQIVCTAAYAEPSADREPMPVILSGTDGALPTERCEAD